MLDQTNSTKLELKASYSKLKDLYKKSPALTIKERKETLLSLQKSLLDHQDQLYKALSNDFGYRSEFDSFIADFSPSLSLIKYSLKKLKKWMRPSKRHSGLLLFPSRVHVHYQPLGVIGVVVPWNFPLYLSLAPIITAISAGNKVMVKMSEFTPHTNAVVKSVFQNLGHHVLIFEGDHTIASEFTRIPFDHLFFTGSTAVGKIVAKAAAENLTPVTLELGGKSPAIITQKANLKAAVDAILLGKSLNCGQICVSPDYLFIHESLQDEFISQYQKRFNEIYIDNPESQENQLTHIINERHYERLNSYLTDAKEKGAQVICLNDQFNNPKTRKMAPCLITKVTDEMTIMQEEIFGPLLPIKTFTELPEVIGYINNRPRPLALYIMSEDKAEIKYTITCTHSGGVGVNDTITHVGADDAPFGGVGDSGYGQYHGEEGFRNFSKAKTVLTAPTWLPKNGS